MASLDRSAVLHSFGVTADQMRAIEARVFESGMPVAALMEKVGGLLTNWISTRYPLHSTPTIGILAGSGHNGGDALVVARELLGLGYAVQIHCPLPNLKALTAAHARYAHSLGIPFTETIEPLLSCDLIIDGLFGFGLTRSLEDDLAALVDRLNQSNKPIVSIDLPSGLHTDTGAVLGTAVRATHTLCLGLWKLAFLQDQGLAHIGKADLIDFGLPLAEIHAVLGDPPAVQRLTIEQMKAALPLPRPPATHKYQQGHLLLVCGSRRYMGAALLAARAARASGVGMLSIAVPESLRRLVIGQVPESLVVGCPEDETGAIRQLPDGLEFSPYHALAVGPGLSSPKAIVPQLLKAECPIVLDADGLNLLAELGVAALQNRSTTVLTPHPGEFKRLFPEVALSDRIAAARTAAHQSGAIVLLKGAKTAIASPSGTVWLNPTSTPALARGGSGDVLTGLMGGLIAQGVARSMPIEPMVCSAAVWHAQAAVAAAHDRTELGVDASTLIDYLLPTLRLFL